MIEETGRTEADHVYYDPSLIPKQTIVYVKNGRCLVPISQIPSEERYPELFERIRESKKEVLGSD